MFPKDQIRAGLQKAALGDHEELGRWIYRGLDAGMQGAEIDSIIVEARAKVPPIFFCNHHAWAKIYDELKAATRAGDDPMPIALEIVETARRHHAQAVWSPEEIVERARNEVDNEFYAEAAVAIVLASAGQSAGSARVHGLVKRKIGELEAVAVLPNTTSIQASFDANTPPLYPEYSQITKPKANGNADPSAPIEKAKRPQSVKGSAPEAGGGYTFAQACTATLATRYQAKGIAEPGAVSIFFGDSGTLKSFITTDLAAHIGAGLDWCSRIRVRATGVLVVLGEGQAGYAKRLRAWAMDRGIDPVMVHLYVAPAPVDLSTDSGALAVAIREAEVALGCAIGFVLIDTYSTNLGDADEQSNSDAARVLGNARLVVGPDRALAFVHHVGHGEKGRERGAYQLRANADFRFLVERDGATITMTNPKSKDGRELAPMHFHFRSVQLGQDADGDPITSLVVEPAEQAATPRPKTTRLPAAASLALDALREIAGQKGRPSTATGVVPGGKTVIDIEDWRERFRLRYGTDGNDGEAIKKAFQRARERLAGDRIIGISGGVVWIW